MRFKGSDEICAPIERFSHPSLDRLRLPSIRGTRLVGTSSSYRRNLPFHVSKGQ